MISASWASAESTVKHESCLGVADKGIWADLDEQVQLTLPKVTADRVTATIDDKHALLVLSIDGFPRRRTRSRESRASRSATASSRCGPATRRSSRRCCPRRMCRP